MTVDSGEIGAIFKGENMDFSRTFCNDNSPMHHVVSRCVKVCHGELSQQSHQQRLDRHGKFPLLFQSGNGMMTISIVIIYGFDPSVINPDMYGCNWPFCWVRLLLKVLERATYITLVPFSPFHACLACIFFFFFFLGGPVLE